MCHGCRVSGLAINLESWDRSVQSERAGAMPLCSVHFTSLQSDLTTVTQYGLTGGLNEINLARMSAIYHVSRSTLLPDQLVNALLECTTRSGSM